MDHTQRLAAWLRTAGPTDEQLPRTEEAWVALADRAAWAGLAGLVLEQAARHGRTLPAACAHRLRATAMAVALRQPHMMRELQHLLRALNRAGIPVMLLKGAALNLTLYDRPELRPMSDLDLLIRPEHVNDALQLFADHGYRRGYDLIRDDFFPKYHYEIELFTDGARPTRIDLHVRPLRPLRLSRTMPDDALWHQARALRLGDAEAWIPRPEFMFLHLAAHAAFHGCARLLWLYDIKRFADRSGPSLDWALVARSAGHWTLSLAALNAIERTEALLGPLGPPTLLHELRRHRVSWRDRWTLRQAPRDAASPLTHVVGNLLCTPGVRYRLGYLRAHLLPGPKHLAGIYPYRHPGWTLCAHLRRALRVMGRVLLSPMCGLAGLMRAAARRGLRRWAAAGAVEIRPSPIHDSGVFARRDIPAGAVIGRYSGTRTDRDGRYVVSRRLPNGRCRRYDLHPPFRFLNHSDTPNARFSKTSKRVYAITFIPRGAEITVDYGAELRYCERCGYEHLVPRAA